MKRLFAILLAGLLVFTACSSSNDNKPNEDMDINENQEETNEDENKNESTEGEMNENEVEEENKDNETSNEGATLEDQKTAGLDAVLDKQKDAEGFEDAPVTIDELTYTAQSEPEDKIGATNIYLTLTNNSEYGIANYMLKAKNNGQDLNFQYDDPLKAGESSEAFSAFLKDGENKENLEIAFISYSVLVSDTEGYSVRYNGEKNTYSVKKLSNESIVELSQMFSDGE